MAGHRHRHSLRRIPGRARGRPPSGAPALAVLCLAALAPTGASAQSVTYTDTSKPGKLQSKVGVGIEEKDFSVRADMIMVGQDGRTQVLPRVTSAWNTLDFLDVKTVLSYQDLNRSDYPVGPSIETHWLLQPHLPFVERVEGDLRRSGLSSQESLKVKFAGLDTGLGLFGGDPLGLQADLTVRDAGEASQTVSKFVSSWGVGRSVDVKTVLRFDSSAAASFTTPAIDTSLVYTAPVSFIEAVEGTHQRSPSGEVQQSLGVRFPEIAGGDPHGSSFKISSRAVVEEMLRTDGLETVTMGVETSFSGFMRPWVGGSNSLSLRIDRQLDELEGQSSSLAYDHSWSPGDTSIGLNLKLLRRLNDVEPSMGITWSTQF